jgi:hypothetical protein
MDLILGKYFFKRNEEKEGGISYATVSEKKSIYSSAESIHFRISLKESKQ